MCLQYQCIPWCAGVVLAYLLQLNNESFECQNFYFDHATWLISHESFDISAPSNQYHRLGNILTANKGNRTFWFKEKKFFICVRGLNVERSNEKRPLWDDTIFTFVCTCHDQRKREHRLATNSCFSLKTYWTWFSARLSTSTSLVEKK